MPAMTVEKAESVLRHATSHLRSRGPVPYRALRLAMRTPPLGVKPELLAKAAHVVFEKTGHAELIRMSSTFSAEAIRAVLRLEPKKRNPDFVFLKAAIDASAKDIERQWADALQGLSHIYSPSPQPAVRAAKRQKVIDNPTLLRAVQAAVLSAKEVSSMFMVLAADGSDESVDALMPFFAAATKGRDDRLDALLRIQKVAKKTPAMVAMFDKVHTLLAKRNDSSPALGFAQSVLGAGPVKSFSMRVRLGSSELNKNRVPRIQGELWVDSADTEWFTAWVSPVEGASTYFNSKRVVRDPMGIGSALPAQWPQWLVRVAKKLDIRWSPDCRDLQSSLRGKNRVLLANWLFGER